MYSIEKKSKIVGVFGRCLHMLLIFGSIVICIEACSKDEENLEKDSPPKERPSGDRSQGGPRTPSLLPTTFYQKFNLKKKSHVHH